MNKLTVQGRAASMQAGLQNAPKFAVFQSMCDAEKERRKLVEATLTGQAVEGMDEAGTLGVSRREAAQRKLESLAATKVQKKPSGSAASAAAASAGAARRGAQSAGGGSAKALCNLLLDVGTSGGGLNLRAASSDIVSLRSHQLRNRNLTRSHVYSKWLYWCSGQGQGGRLAFMHMCIKTSMG